MKMFCIITDVDEIDVTKAFTMINELWVTIHFASA